MTYFRLIFAFLVVLVWPATAFAYFNPLAFIAFSLTVLVLLSMSTTVVIGAITACIARHKGVGIENPFARLFNLVEVGVVGLILGMTLVWIAGSPLEEMAAFLVLATMVVSQTLFVVWRWPDETPESGCDGVL